MFFFLVDSANNNFIKWDTLISDINDLETYNKYCKSNNYYFIFKSIIVSMLYEKEIILLDYDFTDAELTNLTNFCDYKTFDETLQKINFNKIVSKEDLLERLRNTRINWKITLFTSGTTGIPKRVIHNFQSISRFVKISQHTTSYCWAFAYNPTHMAGVQVFMQALLNGNSIVRVFGFNSDKILREIETYNITCISATPTFYRLLLPINKKYNYLKRITSGGEKFSEEIKNKLLIAFPNARFNNVYASTETGSLFASKDDLFFVSEAFNNLIKVVNKELYIHRSLLGETENFKQEWHNTGDLVNVVSESPLRFTFISRNSDIINVGGYKVNPLEVEEVLLTIPGVKNAIIFPKKNSVLGNIICCEIVLENEIIDEITIRTFLQSKLQEFKIPRIYKFVNMLSTTRTGKIKRK